MVALPGECRFFIGGKRLLMFTNDETRQSLEIFNRELVPISVTFNPYYCQFHTVTKADMRSYDAYTGKLRKVNQGLVDEKTNAEITAFQMGPRNRKFFVADNAGYCRMYNVKSGEMISEVIQPPEFNKAKFYEGYGNSDTRNQESKVVQRKSIEICQLIYVEEQKMMIAVSVDSVVRIYEVKQDENISKLREIRGGHMEAEITCAEYSRETLSLYTGASNGTVAIWSFESSRLSSVLKDENADITRIKDCFPYPALLACSSKGILNCWKTRESKKTFPLLFKISIFDSSSPIPIKSITSLLILPMMTKITDSDGFARKVFIPSEYHEELSKRMGVQLDSKFSPVQLNHLKTTMMPFFKKTLEVPSETSFTRKRERGVSRQDSLTEESIYFFVGLASGVLQAYPLHTLLEEANVQKLNPLEFNLKRFEKFKVSLMRKDNVNGDKTAEKLVEDLENCSINERHIIYIDSATALKSWRGHKKAVSMLNEISPNIDGFISSGKDQFVKYWSPFGQLWGQYNIITLEFSYWEFPYDWVELILNELDEVFDIIERLDKIDIGPKQREILQARYFYNNYILPELKDKNSELVPKGFCLTETSAKVIQDKIDFFNRIGDDQEESSSSPKSFKLKKKSVTALTPSTPREKPAMKFLTLKSASSQQEFMNEIANIEKGKKGRFVHQKKQHPAMSIRTRYDIDKNYWEMLDNQKNDREKMATRASLPTCKSELALRCSQRFDGLLDPESEYDRDKDHSRRVNDTTMSKNFYSPESYKKKKLRLKKNQVPLETYESRNILTDYGNKLRMSGLPRPASLQKIVPRNANKKNFTWDIKYQLGEAGRVFKRVTSAAMAQSQAQIGSRPGSDLQVLQANALYREKLLKNGSQTNSSKKTGFLAQSGDIQNELDKIVAKKSFFLNPSRNDPKIIKTKNRLYVI